MSKWWIICYRFRLQGAKLGGLKGIVQNKKNKNLSKNKNCVIIYSPSSSSKPVWMSLFCGTQRKIFWRMWETEQFWSTIDFHSIFFSYSGSQWCPKTAWLQTFFKISSFVFSRTKKFIQVWNFLRVSKWWQNFHFWVNYPFKWALNSVYVTNRPVGCWTTSHSNPSLVVGL